MKVLAHSDTTIMFVSPDIELVPSSRRYSMGLALVSPGTTFATFVISHSIAFSVSNKVDTRADDTASSV